jgi:DNA-directed RNA polymerase II subunit RPB2
MDKVLPHVGTDEDSFQRKAYFIGYMTKKLLFGFLGKADEDDRDHYGKKRLDMTGVLMTNLFKEQFRNIFIENAKKIIRRKLHSGKGEF